MSVPVALAGIAGYGEQYLEALFHDPSAGRVRLIGVVDPAPQRCRKLAELQARGIPIHASLDELFAATPVELLITSTPIHLHARQTCFGLQRGANVLCEKPLAGSLADAQAMAACERAAAGKFAAIGYQWCFSEPVQRLKQDIMGGVLKRPRRMKAIVLFPRSTAYYARNNWAGRLRTDRGEMVLDSPANNAASHYLHNMLYLLGDKRESSAMPVTVQAERYRANAIENYDTVALRATLASGCEVLFYASHAIEQLRGPLCRLEFENAAVDYDMSCAGEFCARFEDGRLVNYGSADTDRWRKIWHCVDFMEGGAPIACGIETAMPHTVVIETAQRARDIVEFPQALRRTHSRDGKTIIYIEGMADALKECYERGVLPAETGTFAWSQAAAPVNCADVIAAAT
jgi:predicted dehydrogenase